MSYDVWLQAPKPEKDKCDACGRPFDPEGETTESRNYTSNMAGAWDAAGAPLRYMDGMLGKHAIPILENAIRRIEGDMPTYRAVEPDNGWGKVDSMLDFLRGILADCREHQTWLVKVCR